MYFIHPEYTGKGIGGQILKKVEEAAGELGIKRLLVDNTTDNERSIGFHRKNGFVEYGRLKNIGKKFGRSFFVFGFALLGLIQLIKRNSLRKVDFSILVLGGYYALVMATYILFEVFVINYRPILIDGYLEASYPSSTTMLVMCVIPTAIMQLCGRMKKIWIRKAIICVLTAFTVFMVVGAVIRWSLVFGHCRRDICS